MYLRHPDYCVGALPTKAINTEVAGPTLALVLYVGLNKEKGRSQMYLYHFGGGGVYSFLPKTVIKDLNTLPPQTSYPAQTVRLLKEFL